MRGSLGGMEIVRTGQRKRLDLRVVCPFDASGDLAETVDGVNSGARGKSFGKKGEGNGALAGGDAGGFADDSGASEHAGVWEQPAAGGAAGGEV